MPRAQQHIDHTTSRRTGPRKWLRAVAWLLGAGLHPKANTTTLCIAEDLAARMDYDTGHVLYGMRDIAARLDLDVSNVKRHVRYLRELGALAWVQHGTRTNSRRAKGESGWAGTATVYAAVIPAAYDHAMGHRIIGSGYTARIVVDLRNRPTTPSSTPAEPVDNSSQGPVDNSPKGSCAPPSLTSVQEDGKLKMVGGSNYTSQARPPKPRVPHQSSSKNGHRRTALDVQQDMNTARLVRAMVNWTQSVPLRKLEYVLRWWTDRGQDAYQIAADLNGMCLGLRWNPKNPVAFIRARLTADAEHHKQQQNTQAAAARWEAENPVEGAFQAPLSARLDFMAGLRQGLARYQQQCAAYGHDDLTHGETPDWDAEADILAFLGSPA
ncbi:hypothetical protein SUDANB145_07300 (plasmid) [Streptomyces sp. enrichment culture]|uniref:cell wall protein n=1 Tax=Streptomyces sp. enrichment culture TaxID=1795815 RepID=UPI003F55424A